MRSGSSAPSPYGCVPWVGAQCPSAVPSLHRCYFTFLLFTPRDFLWGLGQFAYILIYKKLSGAGCCSESDLPVLNLKELNNFPLLLRCVESDSRSSHHLSLEKGAEGNRGVGKEPSGSFSSPMALPYGQWGGRVPIHAIGTAALGADTHPPAVPNASPAHGMSALGRTRR